MSDNYDMIDRFLRNNLDDTDYAEYSAALDNVLADGTEPAQQDTKRKSAGERFLDEWERFESTAPQSPSVQQAAQKPLTGTQIIAMRAAVPDGEWASQTEAEFFACGVKAAERHHGIGRQAAATERLFTFSEVQEMIAHARAIGAATEPKALTDVVAERERQKTAEGWTPEHDDKHDDGSLGAAAACYTMHSAIEAGIASGKLERYADPVRPFDRFVPDYWPWDKDWWKPKGGRRNLVKAGALILAEIERLDRAALAADQKGADHA